MKFARSTIHSIQVNIHTENISDSCKMDNTDYQKISKLMNTPVVILNNVY